MIVVKSFKKKKTFFLIILKFNIEKCNLAISISNDIINISNFVPDFINSFEQSRQFDIFLIFLKKKFFHQFIFNNFANYNKFIYKIEKEIEELRLYILNKYALYFGV